jgi:hypothetical protein
MDFIAKNEITGFGMEEWILDQQWFS